MFKKIWDWLNNQKTLFGIVLQYFVDKPGYLFGSEPLELIFGYIAGLLIGGGLAHKGIKLIQNIKK